MENDLQRLATKPIYGLKNLFKNYLRISEEFNYLFNCFSYLDDFIYLPHLKS